MKDKSLLLNLQKVKNMKKRLGSRIGNTFNRIIDIRFWFDWERMKAWTHALMDAAKRMFVPQQPVLKESFDAAKSRMKLSDRALLSKQKALFRLSMVMMGAAISLFAYSIYQLFYGSFIAFVISLIVMSIALVLAFRYHFWYFQIKHRKLGCSISEWYRMGILGEKQ